jgi:hypothetical protein
MHFAVKVENRDVLVRRVAFVVAAKEKLRGFDHSPGALQVYCELANLGFLPLAVQKPTSRPELENLYRENSPAVANGLANKHR